MATILLSAVGAAVGGSLGGSVLGLSASVLGRAAGATLGRVIDARILGAGSPAVETGRIDRFRLTGASEGAPVASVHGRARLSGQVIWSSRFREDVAVSGGGKGAPSQPKTTSYSYSVSLAVALCEGTITRVGRVWADGNELSKSDLSMRVYPGTMDQLPDPKIEAVEGAGRAPAYRGTAYVVIEDLPLAPFGNRVPQFSFEVMRTGEGDLSDMIGAVAMIPGTGEYALATTPVHFEEGPGRVRTANVHTPNGGTDFEASLEALTEELPRCGATSLVVSWFGSDLRCGSCVVMPKVEQDELDGKGMPWRVSGLSRSEAALVPRRNDRPVYGGTPADASVVEAIRALKNAGQEVMFYPFLLMEQMEGNGLPDPWTGSDDQPVLPWRGRITTSVAPGGAGSPDGTSQADAEVAAFFGTAVAGDYSNVESEILYDGADGFSYRRFILHYAHLCAAAGGVDAFCIGSEMRSLTQIRGVSGSFPAVEALRSLAAEVREVMGPAVRIGYAADWSEYFGYHPQDGSGDVLFHLDPLWADEAIDFVGIDNYMPLSDWRDAWDHADSGFGSVHNISYLKENIAAGEGFDWYYPSAQAEAVQLRMPITDGAYGEPWVWRYKDLAGWWTNAHHDRIAGVRQPTASAWVPQSKPIWFTELGCAAVDKGTNEPNRFLDPKSSESSLPKHSTGARDDLMQMQYLRAMSEFWSDAGNNPVSDVYGAPMIDTERMFVWAWDARPYPWFPANAEVWGDGENYARGHWLNGRATSRTLDGVIRDICAEQGVEDVDVSDVWGLVRGYAVEGGASAREALQPLLMAHGVDAVEREGQVVFRMRDGQVDNPLDTALFARDEAEPVLSRTRLADAEVSGRVRLTYVEADGDYEARATEGIFPDEVTTGVARSELPLVLTGGEAQSVVDRWLAEARVAREGAAFSLPPSSTVRAGDVVTVDGADYRVDRLEEAGARHVEAVRVERGLYRPFIEADSFVPTRPHVPPLPVWAEMMDLPILRADAVPDGPWVAAVSEPWPGEVAVYSSIDGERWSFEAGLSRRAVMGVTLNDLPAARAGLWDRGPDLSVRLAYGTLASVDEMALFAGGNVGVIGSAESLDWEVFQFREAELTAPDTWSLSQRLRGLRGTEGIMPATWPAGSTVVVLDAALQQIVLPSEARGLERHYRVGPATKPVDHASYVGFTHVARGVALRPFAPVHLRWALDGAGGHVLTWIRQTRIDGDSWTLAEVPLGEASERYSVEVWSAGTRRRSVSTDAPFFNYSAVERDADGLAGPYEVRVAQLSDLYGPGLETRIIIDG